MLKILVCVKQVPDVDQMRMDPEPGLIIDEGSVEGSVAKLFELAGI